MKNKNITVIKIFIFYFFINFSLQGAVNMPTAPQLEQQYKNAKIEVFLTGMGSIFISNLRCNILKINSIDIIHGMGNVNIEKTYNTSIDADLDYEAETETVQLLLNDRSDRNYDFSNFRYQNVALFVQLSGMGNIKLVNSTIGYLEVQKVNNTGGAGNIALNGVDKYEQNQWSIDENGKGLIVINGCKILEKNNNDNNINITNSFNNTGLFSSNRNIFSNFCNIGNNFNCNITNSFNGGFNYFGGATYKNCTFYGTGIGPVGFLILLGLCCGGTFWFLKVIKKIKNRSILNNISNSTINISGNLIIW